MSLTHSWLGRTGMSSLTRLGYRGRSWLESVVAAAPPADLEAVLVYDVVEAVVAHAVFFAERGTVHTPQLAAADAAVLLTDAPDILHTERLLGKLAHGCVAMLVVGLGRHTKQPTQRRDTVLLHVASV